MSTKINPYLNFEGNSREALEFYKEVFSGDISIFTYGDSPMEVDEESKDKIMHGSLSFGENTIMISDAMPGHDVNFGNSISISINETDEKKAVEMFEKLSEGANVLVKFEKQFWDSKFGMLTDKFGINWMVNCEI